MSDLKILHVGKYFSPFSGGVENYMRDAMLALSPSVLPGTRELSLDARAVGFSLAVSLLAGLAWCAAAQNCSTPSARPRFPA